MVKQCTLLMVLICSVPVSAGTREINTGLTLYQRMTSFEHEESTEPAFTMNGYTKPRPWLGINFGDQYFGDSHWGHTVGASYYIEHSDLQRIKRGDNELSTHLGTRSRTQVVAIKPALFYRFDITASQALKTGIGTTFGYSRIRGSAYQTESQQQPLCHRAAGHYLDDPTGVNKYAVYAQCERIRYSSNTTTLGALVFMEYELRHWRWELAVAIYNQTHSFDHYRFSAKEVSLGVARRWSF
ncbi:hypothetical protein [Bacterioplanes sanyensis]|nr:hypothetical protein [Bacterioplanes sanyensis]